MINDNRAISLEPFVRAASSVHGTITHLSTAAEGHIDIQDLSVSYGKRTVVEGVTLRVPRNSVTALIGPSGCGKSSLLYCINRLNDLVPGCSVEGSINFSWMDNKHLAKNSTQLRRQVGMLFQRPNPFHFRFARTLSSRSGSTALKRRPISIAVLSRHYGKWGCGTRFMIVSTVRPSRCPVGSNNDCVLLGRWF